MGDSEEELILWMRRFYLFNMFSATMYARGLVKIKGRRFFLPSIREVQPMSIPRGSHDPTIHLNQKWLKGRIFAGVQLLNFTFMCRIVPRTLGAVFWVEAGQKEPIKRDLDHYEGAWLCHYTGESVHGGESTTPLGLTAILAQLLRAPPAASERRSVP